MVIGYQVEPISDAPEPEILVSLDDLHSCPFFGGLQFIYELIGGLQPFEDLFNTPFLMLGDLLFSYGIMKTKAFILCFGDDLCHGYFSLINFFNENQRFRPHYFIFTLFTR